MYDNLTKINNKITTKGKSNDFYWKDVSHKNITRINKRRGLFEHKVNMKISAQGIGHLTKFIKPQDFFQGMWPKILFRT